MIVVDLEMSGMNIAKCGIWQIGAIDTDNPKSVFLEEARVDEAYEFLLGDTNTQKLFGKTEAELRDKSKQSEKELLQHFFRWCEKSKFKNAVGHCVHYDFAFLQQKAFKYGLEFPLSHRIFDTHSIASMKYFELNGKFLMKKDKPGMISDMGLKNVLELVGMKDERLVHNALGDAKLTAEAFYRLVYGKNLLKEYAEIKIPEYLIKEGPQK
jgi:DNA polymerase III epsilon subunit-like protein